MAMKWNSRDYQFDPNGGNSRSSFQEHNEHMRKFRGSHADIAMVNGPRLDEAALIERMEPLQICRIMMERGGSALPNATTTQSTLVPILRVARYKLSQN